LSLANLVEGPGELRRGREVDLAAHEEDDRVVAVPHLELESVHPRTVPARGRRAHPPIGWFVRGSIRGWAVCPIRSCA